MNSLINVSEGYIPNLGSVGPLLHVEKFVVVVVVVVVGWWVCKAILVITLGLLVQADQLNISELGTAQPQLVIV